MVFSTRSNKSSARTTNLYEPFPRSASATALGSPKRPTSTSAVQGQGGSPATPGRGSRGSRADLGSPESAAAPEPVQWQPRDRAPTWQFQSRGNRRRSGAVQVQVGAGSPGIKRLQTSGEQGIKRLQASGEEGGRRSVAQSGRGSLFELQDARKPVASEPTFQASQGSPGLESVSTHTGGNLLSTNTGGNPWSPGRYGRLKRYSVGGATQVFKDEDLPREAYGSLQGTAATMARGNPQAWVHSDRLHKWERRLYGDVKMEDHDALHSEERQHQQALDSSLSEAFGQFSRSPRATSRECIASHPAQSGMRAAFTDRSLKQAHMAEHWSLAHTEARAEDSARRPSVGCASPASFDMLAAGEGATSRGPRGALDTMHVASPRTSSPGYAARSRGTVVGYHLRRSPREPERDLAQAQLEESLLRSKLGPKRQGEMAPSQRQRALSADPWAGLPRQWGSKLDLFSDASPREGADKGRARRRQVRDWLPSDRVTMSHCFSPRDGAAAEPVPMDIVFVHGQSPPTTKFCGPGQRPQKGGRPNAWSDPTRSYSLGRRGGRGEGAGFSAEATRHSAARDAESVAMYKYERIATGEDRPRACSQPPAYNPLTHQGELYPSLESSRSLSRGKRMSAREGRHTSSRSAGRALDHEACREEAGEVRENRMRNEKAFSDLCSATITQNKQLSQEFAQIFRQNHHQKSSNMALLLTWE